MRRENLWKLICIALSAVMIAGLTVCGGGDAATETTTAAGAEATTEGDGIHFTSAGGITYPLENTTTLTY